MPDEQDLSDEFIVEEEEVNAVILSEGEENHEKYLEGLESTDRKQLCDVLGIRKNFAGPVETLVKPIKLDLFIQENDYDHTKPLEINYEQEDESDSEEETKQVDEINVILHQSQLKTIDEENSIDILSNSKRSDIDIRSFKPSLKSEVPIASLKKGRNKSPQALM